jgi:acetyl-CoA/propionyl-CoA/long-chain acyl-CoA carboxylase, biotin carboxylase, biotin carboxyl carrier protein
MPTVLPFHRAVVRDKAFTGEPFSVHTRWIETEFGTQIPPYAPEADPAAGDGAGPSAGERERIVVEVGGKRLEVVLPAGLGVSGSHGSGPATGSRVPRAGRRGGTSRGRATSARGSADGDSLVSPMQGTIVKIVAPNGERVAAGDTIVVLEAMKMEQPLTAHKDGTVSDLAVEVGQTVSAGQVICRLAG